MILSNLQYNQIQQEIAQLRAQTQTMKEALELIATSNRGGGNKRVAQSCLDFLKNLAPPARELLVELDEEGL